MNTIVRVLSGLENVTNAEEFSKRRAQVLDAAFDAVFQADQESGLVWARDLSKPYRNIFTTTATVKNAKGEEVTVPMVLYNTADSEGFWGAYLYLGTKEDGTCRNNADERVAALFKKVSGKSYDGK